jgi:hypothetical protein
MSSTMPEALVSAILQLRTDASDFMRHNTTASFPVRRMCRVGVSEMALLLAWLDQHYPSPAALRQQEGT